MYTVMDFDGLSTGPICHINAAITPGVVGAGTATGATPPTVTQLAATAAVNANAANQALIAQQAAANVSLPTTVPTKFNSNNLAPKAKARYENHLNTSYLMTETDMQPFPTPLGEVCPVLSYLGPPMGSGVTRQPDSNRVITRNGQFFSLVDQGNSGLKVFLTSVSSCIGTSLKAV